MLTTEAMPILVLDTMDHPDSGTSAQLEAMGAPGVEQARRLVDIAIDHGVRTRRRSVPRLLPGVCGQRGGAPRERSWSVRTTGLRPKPGRSRGDLCHVLDGVICHYYAVRGGAKMPHLGAGGCQTILCTGPKGEVSI
jgi:hypothetical protein